MTEKRPLQVPAPAQPAGVLQTVEEFTELVSLGFHDYVRTCLYARLKDRFEERFQGRGLPPTLKELRGIAEAEAGFASQVLGRVLGLRVWLITRDLELEIDEDSGTVTLLGDPEILINGRPLARPWRKSP